LTLFCQTLAAQSTDPTALARLTLDRLVKGDYAAVVATFDPKMRAALPEDKLRATWASVQAQTGKLVRQLDPRIDVKGEFRIVVLPLELEQAKADFTIVVSGAGAIVGLNIRPSAPEGPFTDAPYVVRDAFTERDVTVDAGGWPLPGTLSVPAGAGPWPAVVLVHGSGPNDRDETIGPNKPFRDLANGLASTGIAVLRYDKRTRVHAQKVQSLATFTVKEEVVDDAVAAARLLTRTTGIDAARVFVLGHSLGAMLAPRMAAAGGASIRGLVLLAGPARSLEQSIIDQTRYLAGLDGSVSDEEKALLSEFEAMAERAKTIQASDPPLGAGGFNAPASFWVDLRGYHPPTAATRVSQPMLVLQGERDYQVTMDDFAQWRTAVGTQKGVTLKSYPALNHLFIAGTGRSSPPEYMRPGHVAEDVVADIAAWIKGR
jgi:hypothetical protein